MRALAFLALLMAALPAAPAWAASGNSATATGMASATIVKPIAVATTADLDFGTVASTGTGLVDILPINAAALYSGGAHDACDSAACAAAPTATHAASFTVSGEAGRSYTITAPQSLSIVPVPAASDARISAMPPALLVDAITIRSASRPDSGATGQLDAAGQDTFALGGRLIVPADLPPARIVARITVIVAYA